MTCLVTPTDDLTQCVAKLPRGASSLVVIDWNSIAGSDWRMETMERFYDDLDQANLDLQYHIKLGILAWGGDPGPPETPVDVAWLDRFEELRSRRDAAEGAILEAITRAREPAPGL